jgi:hypothetical protein
MRGFHFYSAIACRPASVIFHPNDRLLSTIDGYARHATGGARRKRATARRVRACCGTSPPNPSRKGAYHGVGMHRNGSDATTHSLRFVKNPELPQKGGAIIIRPLSRQPVLLVKGEYPAKWQLDLAPSAARSPSLLEPHQCGHELTGCALPSTDTRAPSPHSVGREIPGNVGKSPHRCGPAFQSEYDLIHASARGGAIT